ncbi:MAG: hypothetical protein AB1801_17850 [Chloroflexota bacterium]
MAASLELAIKAIRSGRKEEGRQLLNLLIQQNPNDEQAWLWMSSVVETDEQRARCLYHALAINPENEIARKGLKILGIVVTDSRPVKIPRDSQPIQIPNPTSQAQAAYPQATQLDSKPVPAQTERRPFRIDPQAIVEELPFTPVRQPFAEPGAASPSKPAPAYNLPEPAEPPPSKPVYEPVPAPAEPAPLAPQLPAPGGTFHETRPSHPVSVPQPGLPPGPGHQYPYPVGHSNVTMGMPAPYFQPANPSPPLPGIHSNPTMGMNYPGYPQAQLNSQAQFLPEPVPAIHSSGTMPMQAYPQPQFQPMMPAQPSIHSSATMAVPMGFDPFTALSGSMAPGQNYYEMNPPRSGPKKKKQVAEEEDEGEVNILAVIIFGSLSVTALGGLGMLILLMFTSG